MDGPVHTMPKISHKLRPSPRPGALIVLVTCPTRKVGEGLGHLLVQERLAACVNIVPNLISVYRWEGKVRRQAEVLLIIKTRRIRLAALIRRVQRLHPYSVPEIVALPSVGGSAPYLSWLRDSTA
jgi:periplasmic divalent cation tolerance protein